MRMVFVCSIAVLMGGIAAVVGLLINAVSAMAHRAARRRDQAEQEQGLPWIEKVYEPQSELLTSGELEFYHTLRAAVGNEFVIMCQVALSEVIRLRPMDPSDRLTAFNKISSKVLDYVLCDSESLTIVAAIELDDQSHQRVDQVVQDAELDRIMKSVGIELLRFSAQAEYSREELVSVVKGLNRVAAA